jgi:hypothetical protein
MARLCLRSHRISQDLLRCDLHVVHAGLFQSLMVLCETPRRRPKFLGGPEALFLQSLSAALELIGVAYSGSNRPTLSSIATRALRPSMEEKQVHRKILVTDLQRIFGADKAELTPQLD